MVSEIIPFVFSFLVLIVSKNKVESVPRCEIPTPNGATACDTIDTWRDDILCRVFGSYVAGAAAGTDPQQLVDGLVRDAYSLVISDNKHTRKMANRAVVS